MNTAFQFEVSHKSGTIDCLTVAADSLAAAWRCAKRMTAPGITTAKVRAPDALGDTYWHSLSEARKLEHIKRTAPRLRDIHDALRADERGVVA